jgi:hypothetical protein
MGIKRGSKLRPFPVTREGGGVIDGEEGSDKVAPPVSEEESNGSGRGLPGLRAVSEAGPNGFPRGPFLFLFLFSLFPILFSQIFQTLFKFDPNRSKPTLQSFKNSRQPYRTVMDKFS